MSSITIVSDAPNCGITYNRHYDDRNSFIIQATEYGPRCLFKLTFFCIGWWASEVVQNLFFESSKTLSSYWLYNFLLFPIQQKPLVSSSICSWLAIGRLTSRDPTLLRPDWRNQYRRLCGKMNTWRLWKFSSFFV